MAANRPRSPALAADAAAFLRHLQRDLKASYNTVRCYRGDLRGWQAYVESGAVADFHAPKPEEFAAYLDQLRSAGLKPSTVKRKASALRGFCDWLAERRQSER